MRKIFFVVLLTSFFYQGYSQLKTGDFLPHSVVRNVQNEKVDLSSFQGKVLLVDFWASWCGPCRVANKKLVLFYSKYKSTNFEMIGISLDVDPVKWESAVKKDKIEYIQLNEPKGFDAKVAIQFGIEQLPTSYLFDKTGTLIMINPTEEEIITQIKKSE